MKKTYLARRNALLSSADLSWGAFALAFAVLALCVRLLAPNLFWYAAAPLFRGADALAEANHRFFSGFESAAALALENEKLSNENTALATENRMLLQKEADQGALLGAVSSKRSTRGTVAGVISRPPASPYDTLVVAAGADAGITLGQEAFGPGGVPLGVVSSVLADFSRVTLFSSSGMSVEGWVGRANTPLTVRGAGGGTLRASLSRSAGIAAGDMVSVPGPGALPVGSVMRVDSDPSSPSVTLQIQPALNPFSLTWVELRDTGATFAGALTWATSTLP